MNSPVQSPARETSSRYPRRPGVVTVAKACHSRSGLRLIPTADATAGVTPWSRCTTAACEESRSTRTGTRRSRSQGEVNGQSPEEPDRAPAAEPVRQLEHVVRPAAHRGGGADDDDSQQDDEAVGQDEGR